MQIRKMSLMLVALVAVGMTLTACGDEGRESLSCTDNAGCLENEICHPDAKVCVQTCTAAADCPDSSKKCEAISSTNAQMICKCTTTEFCQGDERVSDASTLSCSTAYSVCVSPGTTPACTKDADCSAGQTCETSTGTCKTPTTGATCSGEGKSTCNYGELCSTSSKCAAVPAPTCDNYQNFTAKSELGTTGPILFKATTEGAAVESFCGTGSATPKRVKVKLSAYSSTAFPDNKDGLSALFYVTVNGNKNSGSALISSSTGNYVVSGTNKDRADMIVSFCVAESSTTLSLGFYFTNGNFLCHQAIYQ
jgi:hypothetical protein